MSQFSITNCIKENIYTYLDSFANKINNGEILMGANTDNHAYSVQSIDKENRTITVINPWNGGVIQTLSYEDFLKEFVKIEWEYIDTIPEIEPFNPFEHIQEPDSEPIQIITNPKSKKNEINEIKSKLYGDSFLFKKN